MPGVADEVDHRAGRAEQPDGRVDDGLQDLVLVVRRAHPAGDLAQRALGVGGPGQLLAGASQLLDQAGVGDRDGGLAGEGPDQARVGLGECRPLLRVDLDDPERAGVAGDRGGDHRPEPGPLVELGRFGLTAGTATPGRRRPGSTRSSATATPVAPTPTEIQSLARSSAVNCPARPSSIAQRRSPVSSMRSRMTPSAPTRRPAWVTTSWRISVGSRRIVIRAAISRSACSASARRARAVRDRSSSSNSRAVRIVMAAWSAIASRIPAVGLAPGVAPAGEDRQAAERTALAGERRGHDRADARRGHVAVGAEAVLEPRVADVVARPVRPPGDDGLAGDPLVERLVRDRPATASCPGGPRRRRRPSAGARWSGRSRSIRAPSRVEEADGLVDAQLEDRREVRGGADPGRDLAQGPLDVGPVGQLASRRVQVLDEPDVGHGRGGMVGQGADEGDGRRAECVGAGREGAHRPEDGLPGDERCDDHRADADVAHDPVRVLRVRERRVVEVVAGQDDRTLGDGLPEHARRRRAGRSSGPTPGCAGCGSRRRARSGGGRWPGRRGRPSPRPHRGGGRPPRPRRRAARAPRPRRRPDRARPRADSSAAAWRRVRGWGRGRGVGCGGHGARARRSGRRGHGARIRRVRATRHRRSPRVGYVIRPRRPSSTRRAADTDERPRRIPVPCPPRPAVEPRRGYR